MQVPERRGVFSLATKRRLYFKYEKRIRDMSPLERVFEYFASQERDGIKQMLPADLLRALVPTYPPVWSSSERAGNFDGERSSGVPDARDARANASIFKEFDVDSDGLVSFYEFLLVVTLLSIPERDVRIIFDILDRDNNGVLDASEFQAIIGLLQQSANTQLSGKHVVGRQARLGMSDSSRPSGLLVSFFGPDQTGRLPLSQFARFLERLHDELVMQEFEHYRCSDPGADPKGASGGAKPKPPSSVTQPPTTPEGYVNGVDFARSLVAVSSLKKVDEGLNRVDALAPQLQALRLTFADFQALHRLARYVHELTVALDFLHQVGRAITPADLSSMAEKFIGVPLSRQVLDVIFLVFADKEGALDVPAFLHVLQRRSVVMWSRRAKHNSGRMRSSGKLGSLWSCLQRCQGQDA